MAESTDNEQNINSAPADGPSQQPFITLPFDEEISFDSPKDLLAWIKDDKAQFDFFRRNSLSYRNGSNNEKDIIEFPNDIAGLVGLYEAWYYRALEISEDIFKIQRPGATPATLDLLNEKKENLIRYWTDLTNEGLVPMQSSIGKCALAMSRINEDSRAPSNSFDSTKQGIAWLHAMTALRKQQVKQNLTATRVEKEISESSTSLEILKNDIQKAQKKVGEYKTELELFQKNALKSAALKSPANALGRLEKEHKRSFWVYGACALGLFSLWVWVTASYYYPNFVKPVWDHLANAPLEAGPMILVSMLYTGISLTAVIVLIRLAVSRINFSVAAGERKAMASSYRALLLQNAITGDQQILFLQSIVGSKLPDFVSSNDIRMPADELTKLVQTILKERKE